MQTNYFCENASRRIPASGDGWPKIDQFQLKAGKPWIAFSAELVGDVEAGASCQLHRAADLGPENAATTPSEGVEPMIARNHFEADMMVLDNADLRPEPDRTSQEDGFQIADAEGATSV